MEFGLQTEVCDVSVDQVEVEMSFHHSGTERVKVVVSELKLAILAADRSSHTHHM